MNRPVVAAVDGSSHSVQAALWAADEAVRRGDSLRLVYVSPWLIDMPKVPEHEDARTAAVRMLSHTRSELHLRHPGLGVEIDPVTDEVVPGLIGVARDSSLLVLGSRGLGGFAGLLLGSVSLAVTAHAESPVVVVPTARPDRPEDLRGHSVPRIVVGVAGDGPTAPVMEFAMAEAALYGGWLHVVHGWDVPPNWSSLGWAMPVVPGADLQAAEDQRLTASLLDWRDKFPDTEIVEEARVGGGSAALVHASEGADMVVIGRRIRTRDMGLRLGPVAHAVLHHAHAPVAVVPHV
jgi:nucleotide-binding universal stress UspA family protein